MFKFEFVGGEEVAIKLKSLDSKVHESLLQTITKLSIELQGYIKSEKLSGQVLKTKTGTLRRSINFKVDSTSTTITGKVGIGGDAAKYGVMHEFGFNGAENVKAHLRTIKQAFGKSITPKQISVSSHTRKVNFPEKSFMRSALKDFEPKIQEEISKALIKW